MRDRLLAVAAVLLVSLGSYSVYNSDLYFTITDAIGYFPYKALTPLASICLLRFIPGRVSANLVFLFCILVYVDLSFWFLSGVGFDVLSVYGRIQWAAFIIEVMLFIPRGAIDGIIDFFRPSPGGILEQIKRRAYNRVNHIRANRAENSKWQI